MVTDIVKFDAACPESTFSRCKEAIISGGVVAYPTDTFYGLGADPRNAAAVQRLFAIKGRRENQPILLLIPDPESVGEWAKEITPMAERLMKEFWPGPLTLVFRAKKHVLPGITAGTGTIGLRMPGSPLTRQLLLSLGTALTGTSANLSGERSIDSAEEAAAVLNGMVDLVLDGGRTEGGKPSTIVDVTSEKLNIIREGAIPSFALRR
jgi:L-threonylcarbamoyladenylate synthase